MAPLPSMPGVRTPRAAPAHGGRLLGVGLGLEGSRRHLLQKALVEGELGDDACEPGMLLFQALEPFRLIDSQAAVFVLPPSRGLLGDAQLAARLDNSQPLARLNVDRP